MPDPQPQPNPTDAAQLHLQVEFLRFRVDGLKGDVKSLRLALGLAAIFVALAGVLGFSAHFKASAAHARAEQVARDLAGVRVELGELSKSPVTQRAVPRARPRSAPRAAAAAEGADESVLRELGRLQQLVGSAPAQRAEVEAGLIAWGAETRRYVDDAIVKAGEVHRRERAEELAAVWQRLGEVESRAGVR